MFITQNWVGYLDRSYQQIKNSLLARLVVNNPEISDHTESNILIILLSMFAGVGEMLNYYIDNMAREAFLATARKYVSVVRHAKFIDYAIKASTSAFVDVVFSLKDGSGAYVAATGDVLIPQGTKVSDGSNIQFFTVEDTTIPNGAISTIVSAANRYERSNVTIGMTDGSPNQRILLPSNFVHGSLMNVMIGSEFWYLYSYLGKMTPVTKGFVISVEEDGNAYLEFGDDVHGAIPVSTLAIIGTFYITDAELANLPPHTITQIPDGFVVGTPGVSLTVDNPDYASGGSGVEDIDWIKNLAPKSLRTLDRAVTYQDYIDIAELVPGVGKAAVRYCCGKFVEVYVLPKTRGNSTEVLLANVLSEMNIKKMITTIVEVFNAGISRVWIQAIIYGKPFYTADQILIDVINALDADYGYAVMKINGRIALSDIVGTMENLEKVDRVDLLKIRVEPFVAIANGSLPLDLVWNDLPHVSNQYRYDVVFDDSVPKFIVYRDNVFIANVPVGDTFNDGIVTMTLNNSFGYTNGNSWKFIVHPAYPEMFPTSIIQITDYSEPMVDVGPQGPDVDVPRTIFSDLTVVTQNINQGCLPEC